MVSFHSQEHGFSLIELMVTIAILGILATTGIALTSKWSQQTELDKAVMALNSGMALARSTALRNEGARATTEAASALCFDNNTKILSVRTSMTKEVPGTPSVPGTQSVSAVASCDTKDVFRYQLGSAITVKAAGTDFACYYLNAQGMVQSTGSCTSTFSLTVANGTLNETVDLN